MSVWVWGIGVMDYACTEIEQFVQSLCVSPHSIKGGV